MHCYPVLIALQRWVFQGHYPMVFVGMRSDDCCWIVKNLICGVDILQLNFDKADAGGRQFRSHGYDIHDEHVAGDTAHELR